MGATIPPRRRPEETLLKRKHAPDTPAPCGFFRNPCSIPGDRLTNPLTTAHCLQLKNIAVVFHLHNFGHNNRGAIAVASAVSFPSEYSLRYHARTLDIIDLVIPDPIPLDRVVSGDPEPNCITFNRT
jgi:hypothetical protein